MLDPWPALADELHPLYCLVPAFWGHGVIATLEHPVTLIGEEVIGLLDVVQLEPVRDHRVEVYPNRPRSST
jgi:hypothetical protein